MEIIIWAIQEGHQVSESLGQLNLSQLISESKENPNQAMQPSQQKTGLNTNLLILVLYLFSTVIKISADRIYCLFAFLSCIVIYNIITSYNAPEFVYYTLFATIYFQIVNKLKSTIAMLSITLLGLHQVIMVIDVFISQGHATIFWNNYTITVIFLHSLIIGNFIRADMVTIKRYFQRIVTNKSRTFGN